MTGCARLGGKVDAAAQALMSRYGHSGVPYLTTGDNNCLFNALSLYVVGHRTLSTKLRARAAIAIITTPEAVWSMLPGNVGKTEIMVICRGGDLNEAIKEVTTSGIPVNTEAEMASHVVEIIKDISMINVMLNDRSFNNP